MQIENVSLIEVIAAARGRHASLVVESTGYLMLGIVRAMGGRPAHVDARRVMLSTEGVVAITGQRKRMSAEEVAHALHALLRSLLGVSQGVGTALRSIAAAEAPTVEALFTGVTKSLIPINRSAAKRALGRLARETVRARNRGQLSADDLEAAADIQAEPSPEPALIHAPQVVAASTEAETVVAPPANSTHAEPTRIRTPTADLEVAAAPPAEQPTAEAQSWEDIDANIDLATPAPAPITNIELATPTPSPIALVNTREEPADDEELDCVLDGLDEDVPAANGAAVEQQPTVTPLPDIEAADRPAVAPPREASAVVVAPIVPCDVDVRSDRAPFIPVTPAPSRTVDHDTPSPLGMTSGTPTIVDVTLYRLTGHDISVPKIVEPVGSADAIDVSEDDDGRVSAMSVQLPPAEPHEERAPAVVEAVPSPPAEEQVPERKSDLELEAELAERLLTAAIARAAVPLPGSVEALLESFGDDAEADAVTEAAASLKRMMRLDPTPAPGTVRPGADATAFPRHLSIDVVKPFEIRPAAPEAPPVETNDIASNQSVFVEAEMKKKKKQDPETRGERANRNHERGRHKPAAARVAAEVADRDVSTEDLNMDPSPSAPHVYDDMPLDVVPSVSPPPVHVADADDRHIPRLTPTEMSAPSSATQRVLFFATTFFLAGVFVVGFLYWQHPHTLGLAPDRSMTSAIGGTADQPGSCYVDLTLKDLPAPHEVLLRLGQASFTSRALPTGVRLELMALASGHQAKRIIVPHDAAWIDGPEGMKAFAVAVDLEPGETNVWPDAPAGEVGGIGPKGTIEVTANPATTELWLVAGAGDSDRSVVTVPCESTAHILVLNPQEPSKRRRLSVEPNMLDAARQAGGAELSVKP